MQPPPRRIVTVALQSIFFFGVSLAFFILSALRSTSFYVCTTWFTCGDRIIPSLSDPAGLMEWLHHWAIVGMVILVPAMLILMMVVFRRDDEAVMIGIRNMAILLFLQAGVSFGVTVVDFFWQAPLLHFMTGSLILLIAVGIVGWAMFSTNQDYTANIFIGVLVVISVVPLVPYVSLLT